LGISYQIQTSIDIFEDSEAFKSAFASVTLTAVMGHSLMQSSELAIESADSSVETGWLENIGLAEKLPVALIFGCILGLSAPTFGLHWLAWFGLVPLLVLVRGARGQVEATVIGITFGLGYHLLGLSWYLGLHPLGWLGLSDWIGGQLAALVWIVESLHEALLFGAIAWTIFCLPVRAGLVPLGKRPYFPYVLSVPFIWVFFQWVVGTSELFLSIPVHQLAYSQHSNLWLLQLTRFCGAGLVDFALVLVNAAIAQIVFVQTKMARMITPRTDQFSLKFGAFLDSLAVAAIIGSAIFYGRGLLRNTELDCGIGREGTARLQSPNVPVAILQSNVSVEEERLKTTSPGDIAKRVADLGTGHGVGLIFGSEGLLTAPQFANGMLVDRLRQISGREHKEILTGSVENFGETRVNTARLFTFLKTKDVVYVKQRLVPFGEFAPLGKFGQDISTQLEHGSTRAPEKFQAGKQAHLLKCLFGRIGVAVGLEVIYPSLISDEVRKGANVLVNISNLGWFHSSSLNKELLAAGVFRAAENGRFLIVASNTGISAVIDPAGVVKSQSLAGKRGVIIDTVQFLYKSTPFSRMCWPKLWWL
jgi:apolipoprotein N-acyltransferase